MGWTVLGIVLVVLLVIIVVFAIWRREKCKRIVRRMSEEEKCKKLNELAGPFGFAYEPEQEIFVGRVDAWQRKEGYERLFDKLAPKFNMVMDAYPVYFDYQDKTWLIEFWKGQYGINTGAEVGVYHTNRLVAPEQRKQVHYNAVSDCEMPLIGICLERRGEKLFSLKQYHWWLAAFRMGMFSQPKELAMYATLTFSNMGIAQAFGRGLCEAGFSEGEYRVKNRRVSILLDRTICYAGPEKLHRKLVQCINRCFCGLFRFVTRPFCNTADRMIFLYLQLPWCFRRMLRLKSFGKRVRVKR